MQIFEIKPYKPLPNVAGVAKLFEILGGSASISMVDARLNSGWLRVRFPFCAQFFNFNTNTFYEKLFQIRQPVLAGLLYGRADADFFIFLINPMLLSFIAFPVGLLVWAQRKKI